ncbi:hypothetical protein GEV33_000268 [Tenebrio molitor]|uniref:Odorant receptor n=1 Tax=Tenebrio molitor TaxID=7067 RepID=A0A8J6HYT0_TENMO|nr:hypothetical protein GEV33_000268 [Tenebrio molitor]
MEEKFVALKGSIDILKGHQFWPGQGETPNTFSFRFRYYLVLLLSVPFWLGVLLHLIVVLKDGLDVDLSGDISVLSSLFGLHFMIITFVWDLEKTSSLFRYLSHFEEFSKPDNFDERCRRLDLYSNLYSKYCIVGMTTYFIIKQLEVPDCERINREKGLKEMCGFFISMWIPFNTEIFPTKWILLALQTFGIFSIIKGGASVTFTAFEVAEYIVLKIKHLKRLSSEAFDDPREEVMRARVNHCVKYHHHIISICELFNSRYKNSNGCYVLMVGIIIAGLANQYMKEKNIGVLLHLGGWMLSFFLSCHAGQSLLSQSLEVADAVLASRWYQAPVDLQKDLVLVMVRAQQPLSLHAMPIGIMSYDLFVAVSTEEYSPESEPRFTLLQMLKTSYSYFTLLNKST